MINYLIALILLTITVVQFIMADAPDFFEYFVIILLGCILVELADK